MAGGAAGSKSPASERTGLAARSRGGVHGVVARLGVKPQLPGQHGLPKPEIASARVEPTGLAGDYNLYRQTERGGDPDMAVLVLPAETIDELNAEGWPVRPGDLGENITTRGIPYAALAPPFAFRVGDAVLETSKACDPCTNLYLLPYVGEERGPAFLKTTFGRRGWYARVRSAGVVRKGDSIVGPV